MWTDLFHFKTILRENLVDVLQGRLATIGRRQQVSRRMFHKITKGSYPKIPHHIDRPAVEAQREAPFENAPLQNFLFHNPHLSEIKGLRPPVVERPRILPLHLWQRRHYSHTFALRNSTSLDLWRRKGLVIALEDRTSRLLHLSLKSHRG